MSLATLRWLGLGLLGIVIAIGVAILASNLASRQIGLASEPVTAGEDLAPHATKSHGHDDGVEPATGTDSTEEAGGQTAPTPPAGWETGGESHDATSTPRGSADDSAGSGGGDGGGRDD